MRAADQQPQATPRYAAAKALAMSQARQRLSSQQTYSQVNEWFNYF
jgi:hypothetical protein